MATLTKDDVTLRTFSLNDVDALAKLANNDKVSLNLRDAFPHPYSKEDAEKFINNVLDQEPTLVFAIEYQGEYVGNIGLFKGSDVYRKSAEIGYFLGEEYWNKGIMTTAINLICDYGFEKLEIVRIHSGVFQYNLPSQRVLEKCGFIKEAIFKKAIFKTGELMDEVRYARLKTD